MIELRDICEKGHQMELRQAEVREKEEDKKSEIICWLLMGVCDECETIIMQGIHQEKIRPTEGIDYIISHTMIEKTIGKKEFMNDSEKQKTEGAKNG